MKAKRPNGKESLSSLKAYKRALIPKMGDDRTLIRFRQFQPEVRMCNKEIIVLKP